MTPVISRESKELEQRSRMLPKNLTLREASLLSRSLQNVKVRQLY